VEAKSPVGRVDIASYNRSPVLPEDEVSYFLQINEEIFQRDAMVILRLGDDV